MAKHLIRFLEFFASIRPRQSDVRADQNVACLYDKYEHKRSLYNM
jgi:hypothetical protein